MKKKFFSKVYFHLKRNPMAFLKNLLDWIPLVSNRNTREKISSKIIKVP